MLMLALSVVSDSFVTSWTVAHQAPLSMESSRQEDCSGLPFPPPGDLPHPEVEPGSPTSPALAGGFFTTEPPGKPHEVSKKKGSKSQARMTYLILILTGGQRSLTWTSYL